MRLIIAALFLALLPSLTAAQGPPLSELGRLGFRVEFVNKPSIWERALGFLRAQVTGVLRPKPGTKLRVVATAYSPRVAETDATPCIGAIGRVRHGVIASNFLPLGTKLRITGGLAELLGIREDEFVVEDRMNRRYGLYRIDVFLPKTQQAREFGRRQLHVEILGYIPRSELRKISAEEFARQRAERLATPTPTPKLKAKPKPTPTPAAGEEFAANTRSGFFEDLQTSVQRAFRFLSARVGISREVDCFAAP